MNTVEASAQARFKEFLASESEEALFCSPIEDPCGRTGFCRCEGPLWQTLGFFLQAGLLELALKLPFNGLKIWLLRRLGAKIGTNVFISVGVYIDPNFPHLLE